MDTTEIVPLTEQAVAKLLAARAAAVPEPKSNGRRQAPRWPFPGTVELWLPDDQGTEQLTIATCINLSCDGLGMLHDDALDIGTEFSIAIHQPEISFHGRAVVRHCTEREAGYFIGVQFVFGGK